MKILPMPPEFDDDCTGMRADPFKALTAKIIAAGAIPLITVIVGMYVQSAYHATEIQRLQEDMAEHANAPVHREAERSVVELRGEISGLRADIQANERVSAAKLESIVERLERIERSISGRRGRNAN